jgi:hypothetical protein
MTAIEICGASAVKKEMGNALNVGSALGRLPIHSRYVSTLHHGLARDAVDKTKNPWHSRDLLRWVFHQRQDSLIEERYRPVAVVGFSADQAPLATLKLLQHFTVDIDQQAGAQLIQAFNGLPVA